MKHKVSIEELGPAVEETLKSGQTVVDAIARKLGYSTTTITKRLEQLELAGRAHRARIPGRLGLAYRWHHGPSPDAPPASIRRDPLVAALFGPPRAKESGNK